MASDMYWQAARYYEKHNTLLILDSPNQESTIRLNEYLNNIRTQYQHGNLSPEVKAKFDKIGMVWDNVEQCEWNYCYDLVKQYQQLFGNLTMPSQFEFNGVRLHDWLEDQRAAYAKGELSLNREAKLSKLDPKWTVSRMNNVPFTEKAVSYYISKVFPDVIETYRPACLKGKELDIYIPSLNIGIEYDGGAYHKIENDLRKNDLCAAGGIKLIRIRDKLCPHMDSDSNCTVIKRKKENTTDFNQTMAKLFRALNVVQAPVIDLEKDKREILNCVVEKESRFSQYLLAAKFYYQENGHLFVPKSYVDPTGVRLGQWIGNIRESKEYLSENQVNALEDIGMVWESVSKEKWLYDFEKATSYDEIPETETTVDGKSLRDWFATQKEKFENYELYDEYKFDAMESYLNGHAQEKDRAHNKKEKKRGSYLEL